MKKVFEIHSEANEKWKTWKTLLNSKGIKKENLCLLSGEKLVKEFLQKFPERIHAEIHTQKHSPLSEKTQFILDAKLFSELDELGTHFNLLVVMTTDIPLWKNQLQKGLSLFLPLSDPSNLGAAIRSALAFDVDEIILTEESANPFLPKCVKASAGSVFDAKIFKGPKLADLNLDFIGLHQQGLELAKFAWPPHSYLLVGEEGRGLQNASPKTKVSIPIKNVESLNAGVAISIALYDYSTKSKK